MKPYILSLNIIFKSGVQKRYEYYSPEALTKQEAEDKATELRTIIKEAYKGEILGSLNFRSNSCSEVLINVQEIASVEFEIVQLYN